MKKEANIDIKKPLAVEACVGEISIYTHAVFCQCILPVRALPRDINHYQVKHGKASLMIQSGVMLDEKGKATQMEVPSGPKARLLMPYIINQAIKTENPVINMGENLHRFMQDNNVAVGGKNARELQRQVNNIAASSINIGVWGETENHRYSTQRSYRIASEVSFWNQKDFNQLSFWNPTLTISEELMVTLTQHRVLLDIRPLIELQDKPRAMDMYMWLSYRVNSIKRPVKISYEDLHYIFGQQTKLIADFKKNFKMAVTEALRYLPEAEVDFYSDKKHIILKNNKHSIYLPHAKTLQIGETSEDFPVDAGVFGELLYIGVAKDKIKKLAKEVEIEKIKKALQVTKQSIEKGGVKNPAGFFTKALAGEWDTKYKNEEKLVEKPSDLDNHFEQQIEDKDWRKIRKIFRDKYGIALFNSWLKEVKLQEKAEDKIILKVKTRFIADYITQKYSEFLQDNWNKCDPKFIRVELVY